MKRTKWITPVLGAALLAFTGMAIAQDSASPNDNAAQASSASKRQKETAKEANGQSGQERAESNDTSKSSGSQLSAKDKMFMKKAAQGGMAEVELGQMVAQKAQSQDVKDFAQKMVDDHSKANDELKSLAQQKGMTLPTDLDAQSKAAKARLEKLSGEQLDRAYMQHMVKDHTKDVSEFKQESTMAKDSDVKSFAGKTLPTLQEHLKMAKQVASKENSEKKSGSTTAQQ